MAQYTANTTNRTNAQIAGIRACFRNFERSVLPQASSGHTARMARYTTPSGRAMALNVPEDTVWPPNGRNPGKAEDTVRYASSVANTTMMTLLK